MPRAKAKSPAQVSFNVCTPIETTYGRTHWFTLGRAWESTKDGKRRILVKLNALPLGRDLHLFEIVEGDSGKKDSYPLLDPDLDDPPF